MQGSPTLVYHFGASPDLGNGPKTRVFCRQFGKC